MRERRNEVDRAGRGQARLNDCSNNDCSNKTLIKTEVLARIAAREARIAVVGLGYVGLPLALTCAQAGFPVTGIDLDSKKVEAVNNGQSYVEDVTEDVLREQLRNGMFWATTDFEVLWSCDVVSICVPTPLRKTGDPDISYIVNVAEEIAQYLHRGMAVILESTTFPGTTTEVVLPRLEENAAGLCVGRDFFLAFSPERIDPGRKDWTTRTTPKVIGGVTNDCLEVALAVYGQVIDTLVPVSSTEAAEMVKLLENTFRAVNIGLVNEVLLMSDKLGLDVWEIIEAAATKPFGFMKFTPGPGLGGHCIPIDPLYLSWKMKTLNYNARFIELASQVNTNMPAYWVQKVQDALNDESKPLKGSRVLLLGVAYKKDVSDVRESPALDILHLLRTRGAVVSYHDPHVPGLQCKGAPLKSITDLETALKTSDCVVITTDHSSYDWNVIQRQASLLVDTRNVCPNCSLRESK